MSPQNVIVFLLPTCPALLQGFLYEGVDEIIRLHPLFYLLPPAQFEIIHFSHPL
jgi:hypothetical protein